MRGMHNPTRRARRLRACSDCGQLHALHACPAPWHVYRDSEWPGVRRQAIGVEPDYDDRELALALRWASLAQWGAGYLLDQDADDTAAHLATFRAECLALGYELTHVGRGDGDRSWRYRVAAIALAAPSVQLALFEAEA